MAISQFLIRDLSRDEREIFEERAALIEYDGKLPRDEADRLAYAEVERVRTAKQILTAAAKKAA